jgi:hypothetical protein
MVYYHISLFQRYGIFCIWIIAQASCAKILFLWNPNLESAIQLVRVHWERIEKNYYKASFRYLFTQSRDFSRVGRHRRMARGGHGFLLVLPGPAMPYPSTAVFYPLEYPLPYAYVGNTSCEKSHLSHSKQFYCLGLKKKAFVTRHWLHHHTKLGT